MPKSNRVKYDFDTEQYFKYNASTGKSRCTIDSCQRLMSGKRASNIIRHYRQIHKIHIVEKPPDDADPISTAWPWNSTNNAEEADDQDVEDEKSDGSVSPVLSLLQVKEDTDSPPPTPTPPAPIRISVAKKSAEKRTAEVLQDISAQELHHSPQQIQLQPQHQEEPPRKSQRVNNISQHTIMKAFGHNVCIQLQDMDRRQRIIAEKLIADVLFHGKLGNLQESTTIALQRGDLQSVAWPWKSSPHDQDENDEDEALVQSRSLTPKPLRTNTDEERSMSPPSTSRKSINKSEKRALEVTLDSNSIVEPIMLLPHQQHMQQPMQQQLQQPPPMTPPQMQSLPLQPPPLQPQLQQNMQQVLPPLSFGNISQEAIMQTFGHNVSIQLQDMDRRQRIIAEKLISDVLFHGKLRNLMETTAITLQNGSAPPLQPAPPTFNSFQESAVY